MGRTGSLGCRVDARCRRGHAADHRSHARCRWAANSSGTYSVYLHVDQAHPELIVNKQTGQWHTVYSPSQDLVRVPLLVSTVAAPVEQLTLSVDPAPGSGTLSITWDRVRYWVAFAVKQEGQP